MASELTQHKILIADVPAAAVVLAGALGKQFTLQCRHTLPGAVASFADDIDLIICGAHFDDCKLFEMLEARNKATHARHIPFLCVRVLDGELDDTLYRSVVIATRTYQAADFIDYSRWVRLYGREGAAQHLCQLAAQLIAKPAIR